MEGSKSLTWNKVDLQKSLKTAVLVGLAALLTYVVQMIPGMDLGALNETGKVIILAVSSGLLHFIQRWIANNTTA